MDAMKRNADGTWEPAQPMGWQAGEDWEVRKTGRLWEAECFHGAEYLGTVHARSRVGLAWKMLVAEVKIKRASR